MNLQTIFPVFIPHDDTPMTDGEAKVFIGMWILLNIAWILHLTFSLIMYLLKLRVYKKDPDRYYKPHFRDITFLDMIMLFCWGVLLLIAGGYLISKYI